MNAYLVKLASEQILCGFFFFFPLLSFFLIEYLHLVLLVYFLSYLFVVF